MNGQTARILSYLVMVICLPSCTIKGILPDRYPTPRQQTVKVPAGWFLMGEDDGRRSNQPQRDVYIDSFEIHLTEVTREEYARFISATSYQVDGWGLNLLEEGADLPMTGILWEDAQAYCRWMGMRLPTEAEWEKSARGHDGRLYPWGNEWDSLKANTAESGIEHVLTIGSYPEGASPYGVLDMSGNAAEWVSDYYEAGYYSIGPDHNPQGPDQILDHVLRGGSFESPANNATTYFRDSSHSARPNPRVGFRCVQ
jgi:formylglycine-generating enzyme required for sulfatase activity